MTIPDSIFTVSTNGLTLTLETSDTHKLNTYSIVITGYRPLYSSNVGTVTVKVIVTCLVTTLTYASSILD